MVPNGGVQPLKKYDTQHVTLSYDPIHGPTKKGIPLKYTPSASSYRNIQKPIVQKNDGIISNFTSKRENLFKTELASIKTPKVSSNLDKFENVISGGGMPKSMVSQTL